MTRLLRQPAPSFDRRQVLTGGLAAGVALAAPAIAQARTRVRLAYLHAVAVDGQIFTGLDRGTFDKPGLFAKDLVIEVTNQEGRRFWGKQSFSGGSEQTSEPMIGELTGKDNKTVVLVDTDGFLDCQLVNNNTMTFCYKQAGGRTESSVVSCSELKRTP